MTFPISIFLYLYYVFLFFWFILSAIGFYHLLRFGGKMFGSYFVGVIYIAGVISIGYLSYMYLEPIDWTTELSILADTSFFESNPIVPNNPF